MSGGGKKVLFLGYDASRTGAPLLLLKFLEWLKLNADISAELLLRWDDGTLAADYKALFPVHGYHNWFQKMNGPGHRVLQKLHLAQARKPDLNRLFPVAKFPVIYANTIASLDFASEMGPNRKCILHVHELDFALRAFKMEQRLRDSIHFVSAYIAASDAVRRYLVETMGIPPSRVSVVHEFPICYLKSAEALNAARKEVRASLGVDENTLVVGMCGSLDWRKGSDLFLQLAVQLKRRRQQFLCVWVGGSAETTEVRHDLASAGLTDVVRIINACSDPERYYPAFDVFALTSREDPFPVAMLEAGASGVAILAFAGAGGAAELIGGDNGMLVPYLDVVAMADEICRLATDRATLRAVGAKMQSKVLECYQMPTQASKLLTVLKNVAE